MRKPTGREVYLRAAELVAARDYASCCAIWMKYDTTQQIGTPELRAKYRRTFGFAPDYYYDVQRHTWLRVDDNLAIDKFSVAIYRATTNPRDLRVWLLCMMAACCEDVD